MTRKALTPVRRRGKYCKKTLRLAVIINSLVLFFLTKRTCLQTLRLTHTPCSKVLLYHQDSKSYLCAQSFWFFLYLIRGHGGKPIDTSALKQHSLLKPIKPIFLFAQCQRMCCFCSILYRLQLKAVTVSLILLIKFTIVAHLGPAQEYEDTFFFIYQIVKKWRHKDKQIMCIMCTSPLVEELHPRVRPYSSLQSLLQQCPTQAITHSVGHFCSHSSM